MNHLVTRRSFLQQSSIATASLAAFSAAHGFAAAASPANKLVVAVMGLSRGQAHVEALLQIPNVEIAWLCEVDEQRLARSLKAVQAKQARAPKTAKDIRTVLEDKSLDALFVAAPNFWHAPATILACAAGKHVYVEKPASHNAREAEWIVAAARKHNRVVQMGNQRRSWPAVIEAIEKLRAGVIGKLFSARTWYSNTRGSIGRGKPVPVPAHLDYTLWQGPAPERPYVDNLVHYNWHWRWHWGGGELANNGVHGFDIARWGLGVDVPRRVTFNGGRYHFDDDQETPDTGAAVFDYGSSAIMWDNSSCHPRTNEKSPFVAFYGQGGVLTYGGGGDYQIFDLKGKEIGRGSGPGGEKGHIENFLDCVRSGRRPNADIEEGQKASMLCHLGNIAYRSGHTLQVDPKTGKIVNDAEAQALWGREYRPGWEPKV